MSCALHTDLKEGPLELVDAAAATFVEPIGSIAAAVDAKQELLRL